MRGSETSSYYAERREEDGFQGLLSRIALAHQQEINELQQENVRLRVQLRQAQVLGRGFASEEPESPSSAAAAKRYMGCEDSLRNGTFSSVTMVMHAEDGRTGPPRSKSGSSFREMLRSHKASALTQQALRRTDQCKNSISKRKARSLASREPQVSKSWLQRLVERPMFDAMCAFMIIFNSVLIGVSIEWLTEHDEEHVAIKVAGHVCSAFFLVELLLRMGAQGRAFFLSGESRSWNIFDLILVVLSIVDFIVADAVGDGSHQAAIGSVVKTIKMLRIARLFRVFRFFQDLSMLALMVLDSLKSLVWALVMLTIITYVFAICLTARASEYISAERDEGEPKSPEVQKYFGSMGRSLHSLIQAMLAGVSWGVFSDTLLVVDWLSPSLFFFYVFFTMLAVLNIVTGVFVENAVEYAKSQRDVMVQKEMEIKEMYVREMQALFSQMDFDASGTITAHEIQEYFDDPRVRTYFMALGLDPEDSSRLFSLLDPDNTGEVTIQDFIDGCLRLKGHARSIDVYGLQRALNRLEVMIHSMDDRLLRGLRGTLRDCEGRRMPSGRPAKDLQAV